MPKKIWRHKSKFQNFVEFRGASRHEKFSSRQAKIKFKFQIFKILRYTWKSLAAYYCAVAHSLRITDFKSIKSQCFDIYWDIYTILTFPILLIQSSQISLQTITSRDNKTCFSPEFIKYYFRSFIVFLLQSLQNSNVKKETFVFKWHSD
jgi:hypothetical protein